MFRGGDEAEKCPGVEASIRLGIVLWFKTAVLFSNGMIYELRKMTEECWRKVIRKEEEKSSST